MIIFNKLKHEKIKTKWIKFSTSSMTDPIALAIAFLGNLETKFLKYLGSILDIIFFKILYFINGNLPTMDLSVCGSIPQESWGTYFQKISFKTHNKSINLKPLIFSISTRTHEINGCRPWTGVVGVPILPHTYPIHEPTSVPADHQFVCLMDLN